MPGVLDQAIINDGFDGGAVVGQGQHAIVVCSGAQNTPMPPDTSEAQLEHERRLLDEGINVDKSIMNRNFKDIDLTGQGQHVRVVGVETNCQFESSPKKSYKFLGLKLFRRGGTRTLETTQDNSTQAQDGPAQQTLEETLSYR